jgi:hypothetical protein
MMHLAPQAGRGHLVVGLLLAVVALVAAIVSVVAGVAALALVVFFLGVWGGVELGRWLEHSLTGRR